MIRNRPLHVFADKEGRPEQLWMSADSGAHGCLDCLRIFDPPCALSRAKQHVRFESAAESRPPAL